MKNEECRLQNENRPGPASDAGFRFGTPHSAFRN